jgi:hypothetical protein
MDAAILAMEREHQLMPKQVASVGIAEGQVTFM